MEGIKVLHNLGGIRCGVEVVVPVEEQFDRGKVAPPAQGISEWHSGFFVQRADGFPLAKGHAQLFR
jgi:hypothetical protein